MNIRPARKLLHFFDRKHLLQRRFLRFMALEKTHSVFRNYAALTDLLVSGKRLAGSIKALIKVSVQNTELDAFGFLVRKPRHSDVRHPLDQLYDLLRHEGQWLRVQPADGEAEVRRAINAVLDARSYHARLHGGIVFAQDWSGRRVLDAILESELRPAGFALAELEPTDGGFGGTIVKAGAELQIAELLKTVQPS